MASTYLQQLKDRLQAAEQKFESQLQAMPEGKFNTQPKEGEWSASQVVAHVAESSAFLAKSAGRIAREERPTVGRDAAGMQAREQALAEHGNDNQAAALANVQQAWREIDNALAGLTDEQIDRKGNHLQRGEVTGRYFLETIVPHIEGHIKQMAEAAGA